MTTNVCSWAVCQGTFRVGEHQIVVVRRTRDGGWKVQTETHFFSSAWESWLGTRGNTRYFGEDKVKAEAHAERRRKKLGS